MNTLDKKTLRTIKKESRELALEMTRAQYQLYDDIWWTRIRITPALYDHGQGTVKDINTLMPNLLTHDPTICTIDEVTELFHFDSTSALVEYLLKYSPRGPVLERFYQQIFETRLQEYQTTANLPADMPF